MARTIWLTIGDIAARLGCSTQHARRLVADLEPQYVGVHRPIAIWPEAVIERMAGERQVTAGSRSSMK